MTRFLNGPVLNLLLAAGIGLSVYYAATLTERETDRSGGPSRPRGAEDPQAGVEAGSSRSVNVAYHRRPLRERRAPEPAVWDLNPGVRRSSSSYPVNWKRRYHAEHAHVQRLLRQLRHARTTQAHVETDWRAKQIAAAETIGHEAGADPWPNCPDPIWDGATSWDVTVACENNGNWLDSPGYYRCGLQFDPMWERRFGALCP